MSLRQSIEEEPAGLRDTRDYLLRHWREELIQIASEFRAWTTKDRAPLPVVSFQEASVHVRDGGAEIELSHGEFAQASDRAAALSRTLGSNVKPRDIVLEFPQRELLRTHVQLPKTPLWTLRKVIGYELMRLSPIEPEQLYFDFTANAGHSKRYDIELRIIKRNLIDEAIAISKEAALHVGAIQFSGDAKPADWQSFPIDRAALGRRIWHRWNVGILAGAAAVLTAFLLITAITRQASWNAAVADAVEAERSRALVVERLERKAMLVNGLATFVVHQKQQPMLIDVLADISKMLPDNTWITEFSFSGNRVRLEGYSHSASDLIGIFDRSRRFTNAEFTAPLTKDDQTKADRFNLSFNVRAQ